MDDLYVLPGSVVNVWLPVATADGNDLVPCSDQARHQIAPDMACGADDDDFHQQ
jgi:hypothetical protein